MPAPFQAGDQIVATATVAGSTSEFGESIPVPEPRSWLGVGIGSALLGALRRRRASA